VRLTNWVRHVLHATVLLHNGFLYNWLFYWMLSQYPRVELFGITGTAFYWPDACSFTHNSSVISVNFTFSSVSVFGPS